MRNKLSILLLFIGLSSLSANAQSLSVSNSEYDMGSSMLVINSEMSSFTHSASASDYEVMLRFQNTSGEVHTSIVGLTEMDGVPMASGSVQESCEGVSSPTLFVRRASLNTTSNALDIESLACGFSSQSAGDYQFFKSVFNSSTQEEASITAALGSLVLPEENEVVFEFKKAMLFMKKNRGRAIAKASISEFDIMAGNEVKVFMAVQNAKTGQSEMDEAVLEKRREYGSRAMAYYRSKQRARCKDFDGPKVILRGVFVHRNKKGITKVYAHSKACNFSHKDSNASDWNLVLGISNDIGDGGSAGTGLTRFKSHQAEY